MTQLALNIYPPGAAVLPTTTRWKAWFARYINTLDERKRRQRARRQFANIDPRTLNDIGVSPAQRFIAINTPYQEH